MVDANWVHETFTKYGTSADDWATNIGEESRKSFKDKFFSGFWNKYCNGEGLDIGGKGYVDSHAVLPTAQLVDLDYPGYNGRTLPFENNSIDYVYSSHCLEHVDDYKNMIQEMYRVTKINGHIIIVVPNKYLYEKKELPPSRWNGDHKRFYSPGSLLREIEESLTSNTFRVRHMQDNDLGHNYDDPPERHGRWLYESEIVLQKIS